MVKVNLSKMQYVGGNLVPAPADSATGRLGTISYGILASHNTSGNMDHLKIKFDAMASHDITYVGIVQTARASGMKEFPLPYVLTNCHNSLCAVGGTINEDDHVFGLSAARKYGGIYVPAHQAVIHQYMRETMAGCGRMLLGSDSHTRYGALGTMGVGEGGPELVKQLCGKTYDIAYPDIVAVYLTGKPSPFVGPQDVALAIIKQVFSTGAVKNKVMEFIGPGVSALSVEFRGGIDVMTTETTCLSSIWATDEKVKEYLALHGNNHYEELSPVEGAVYDGAIFVELDKIVPMIALPFHPSNAYTIAEFKENAKELLHTVELEAAGMMEKPNMSLGLLNKIVGKDVYVDQGVVAGCSGGTYENLAEMAHIMDGKSIGSGAFSLSIYPASQPQYLSILSNNIASTLMQSGATLRSAFCGPCFGAGDVPSNGAFSIRHTTRNFPSREGSRPHNGQIAYVALMDARSIAATAINGGKLTGADELDILPLEMPTYHYNSSVYASRVYDGWQKPLPNENLVFGPNIADWPEMIPLTENLLLTVASAIYDDVTTTDELIPSGETSSYRSNPLKLAEFTLSRKDPAYVGRAKANNSIEANRREFLQGGELVQKALEELSLISSSPIEAAKDTAIGSVVFARKPGDGSAREQAASCQRVLGGCANIAGEYATKRYRSNVINWGMLPFIIDDAAQSGIKPNDRVFVPHIRSGLLSGKREFQAKLINNDGSHDIVLKLPQLTQDECDIILAGCLINYYGQ